MANCPNCGRQTARTKDWCCQWCGYPLFSGSFKMLDKTYKELKAERLGQETAAEEEKEEPVKSEPERVPAENSVNEVPETQPEKVTDPGPEKETIRQEPVTRIVRRVRKVSRPQERPVRRIIRRRRPVSDSEEIEEIVEYIDETPEVEEVEYYDDESEIEEEYEESSEDDVEYEDDEYEEVEPEPEPEPRRVVRRPEIRKPVIRKPADPVPEPVSEKPQAADEAEEDDTEDEYDDDYLDTDDDGDVSVEDDAEEDDEAEDTLIAAAPEEMTPDMEITVDDIVSAYETEGANADARFVNKVLQVTGIIQKVDVKEAMSVYALTLEAEETFPLRQTVRCVFDREHGSILSGFMPSQKVTVMGKYDGSIINISMRDCLVVD